METWSDVRHSHHAEFRSQEVAAVTPLHPVRILALTMLVALIALGHAGASIHLGATCPGWDRIRTGGIVTSAVGLARDCALQVDHTCGRAEVFLRENSRSLLSAVTFYDSYLPFGSEEVVLLDDYDQRVSMVSTRSSISKMMVVHLLLDGGVLMIMC